MAALQNTEVVILEWIETAQEPVREIPLSRGRPKYACGSSKTRNEAMMMQTIEWTKEFGGAVTVCDADGVILSMNEKACRTFAKDGGASLIGKSLYDCHPEKARARIREIMEKRITNAYTIEKAGVKKLIYQAPWYKDGAFAGLVELSIEIPLAMPHFIRPTPNTA